MISADDTGNIIRNWRLGALNASPTDGPAPGVSNESPEINMDWVQFAINAQRRWAKENPF